MVAIFGIGALLGLALAPMLSSQWQKTRFGKVLAMVCIAVAVTVLIEAIVILRP
jgi:hypothetical protein